MRRETELGINRYLAAAGRLGERGELSKREAFGRVPWWPGSAQKGDQVLGLQREVL